MRDETAFQWKDMLDRWHEVRGRRISLKKKLLSEGMSQHTVRRNKEYRALMREQKILSTQLRHMNARRSRGLRRVRVLNRDDVGEKNE